MTQLNDLASRLLRVEQRLIAYRKLHAEELTELQQLLDECKYTLVTSLLPQKSDPFFQDAPTLKEEWSGDKQLK
jgi:hypothetical protein